MKVSAKTKAKPTPISVESKLLDAKTTADLIKSCGEEVIFNAAKGALVISLQAMLRRHIEKGTPLPEIQKAVDAWKPDVRSVVKASAFEKASSQLDKMSPAERAELLKKLQTMPK